MTLRAVLPATWTNSHFESLCSYYGFISCPLTESQLDKCRAAGLDVDDTYRIACDVAAGFPFSVQS